MRIMLSVLVCIFILVACSKDRIANKTSQINTLINLFEVTSSESMQQYAPDTVTKKSIAPITAVMDIENLQAQKWLKALNLHPLFDEGIRRVGMKPDERELVKAQNKRKLGLIERLRYAAIRKVLAKQTSLEITTPKSKADKMAIAAFVFSILSLGGVGYFVFGIISISLGIAALSKGTTKRHLAKTSIIISTVAITLMSAILARIFLVPK